jgi:hypothetical protein
MNLLELSEKRRLEALRTMRDSGVVEAWESVGATVNLVGSVRTGLVMDNLDIDFHIYTDEPMRPLSRTAISRLRGVRDVEFRDLLETPEECLEWHARFGDWRLDMIHIRRGSAFDGAMERVADAISAHLTPATREAILHIKHSAPAPVMGIEVYYAVLELDLRTPAAFAAWKATNPDIDLLGWMP